MNVALHDLINAVTLTLDKEAIDLLNKAGEYQRLKIISAEYFF